MKPKAERLYQRVQIMLSCRHTCPDTHHRRHPAATAAGGQSHNFSSRIK